MEHLFPSALLLDPDPQMESTIKFLLMHLSPQRAAAIARSEDAEAQTRRLRQLVLQKKILAASAYELLREERNGKLSAREWEILSRLSLAVQTAIQEDTPQAVCAFPSREEWDSARRTLDRLAQRHPSLMEFYEDVAPGQEQAAVSTHWCKTVESGITPEKAQLVVLTYPGQALPPHKAALDVTVQNILSRHPEQPPDKALAIAECIRRTGWDYQYARKIPYMMELGVADETKALKAGHHYTAEILLNEDMRCIMKTLFQYLSPAMAAGLVRSANPAAMANRFVKLVREGINALSAREIVLLEGDIPYTPKEIRLLVRLEEAVQKASGRDAKELDASLPFASQNEWTKALNTLTTLAKNHPGLLDVDSGQSAVFAAWARTDGTGLIGERSASVGLVYPGQTARPTGPIYTTSQLAAVRQEMGSPQFMVHAEKAFQEQKEKLRRGEPWNKTDHVFFLDDNGALLGWHPGAVKRQDESGTPLEWYPGDINRLFDMRLEALLKKHDAVWVLGIHTLANGHLPKRSTHMPRIYVPGGTGNPAFPPESSLAVHFKRDIGGSMDAEFMDVVDNINGVADHAAKRPFAYYGENDNKSDWKPLDVLASKQLRAPSIIWRWLSLAQGQPVVLDTVTTGLNTELSFLLSAKVRGRAGFEPDQPMIWKLIPRRNGVEARATYQSGAPGIFVFRIRLPAAITDHLPLFSKQTVRLPKDTEDMPEGSKIFNPTKPEKESIIADMMERNLFSEDDWKKAQNAPAAETIADMAGDFEDSFYKTCEAAPKGLLIFFDDQGEVLDFLPDGRQTHPEFETKLHELLSRHDRLWVGGIKLTNASEIKAFPVRLQERKTIALKKQGFAPEEMVAVRVARTADGAALIEKTKAFKSWEQSIRAAAPTRDLEPVQKTSGVAIRLKGPQVVLHSYNGDVLERMSRGEGEQIPRNKRRNIQEGLAKLAQDFPDLAGDFLLRKTVQVIRYLDRLSTHPEYGVINLEESAGGNRNLARLKAYHELLHDLMDCPDAFLEEILVKKRELEYLFGGAFGDPSGKTIQDLLTYLNREGRIDDPLFSTLVTDYRDLVGRPEVPLAQEVLALIAKYVLASQSFIQGTAKQSAFSIGWQPDETGLTHLERALVQIEADLNNRMELKRRPQGPLTSEEIELQAKTLLAFHQHGVKDEIVNFSCFPLCEKWELFAEDFEPFLTPGTRLQMEDKRAQLLALLKLQQKYFEPRLYSLAVARRLAHAYLSLNEELLKASRAVLSGNGRIENVADDFSSFDIVPQSDPVSVANVLDRIKQELVSANAPGVLVKGTDSIRHSLSNTQFVLGMFTFENRGMQESDIKIILDNLWEFFLHNPALVPHYDRARKICPDQIAPVAGDPVLVRQVLTSAFLLAGHSVPKGEGMSVTAGLIDNGQLIAVEIRTGEGKGLASSALERIPEDLRWTTVERMVQSIGGTISYRMEGGKSASVQIIFAAAPATGPANLPETAGRNLMESAL